MKRRNEDSDHCSYISRMPESDVDSQFGCLCAGAAAALILALVLLLSGCATCYVAVLRSEYSEKGYVDGAYRGRDEYPDLYPATKIATTVEVPSWWWPSNIRIARNYQLLLWPLGAVMSVVDVPISIVSDTCMLPYDMVKVSNHKGEANRGN